MFTPIFLFSFGSWESVRDRQTGGRTGMMCNTAYKVSNHRNAAADELFDGIASSSVWESADEAPNERNSD